jgi:DNA-binding LytR/AlgR family response regulator
MSTTIEPNLGQSTARRLEPSAGRARPIPRVDGPRALLIAIAGALLVGVATGVQAYIVGSGIGQPVRLGPAVELRSLGALIWVLIGTGVVRAARRWPLRGSSIGRALVIHACGAIVAGLALNLILHTIWRATGGHVLPGIGFWHGVGLDAFQNVHYNALVYAIVVAVVTWLDRTRAAAPLPASSASPEQRAPKAAAEPPHRLSLSTTYATRLSVRRRGALVVVPVDEIDWVEGADDYSCLHVRDRRLLSDDRLHALERSLDPARFVRVHRSALVNLTRVREVVEHKWGDALAVLQDGTRVKVSRTRRGELLRRLGGHDIKGNV